MIFGYDSKLMELQNLSQLIVNSWFILVLIAFCNLFCGGFGVRILCVIVQPPKPMFFFDEI